MQTTAMRKSLYILSLIALAQSSGAQTVKKVVLEEFTGAWCGACPNGTLVAESILAANPASCILVAWHDHDPLEDDH